MRRTWVIFLITAICMAVSAGASGQKKIVRQALRVDSMMLQRYRSAKIDTNYVTRPTTRFTLSARFNTAGAKLNTEGFNEGGHFRGRLKADYKSTVSAAVNYLGVTLGAVVFQGKGKIWGGILFCVVTESAVSTVLSLIEFAFSGGILGIGGVDAFDSPVIFQVFLIGGIVLRLAVAIGVTIFNIRMTEKKLNLG